MLIPTQLQRQFIDSDQRQLIWCGGLASGGTTGLVMAALRDIDDPHYTAGLFRQNYRDLTLPGGLFDTFERYFAVALGATINRNTATVTFPSGARLLFGKLGGDTAGRYNSTCFQFVGIDQLQEVDEDTYYRMVSRLRKGYDAETQAEVPLRMRAVCPLIDAPAWVRHLRPLGLLMETAHQYLPHGVCGFQFYEEQEPCWEPAEYKLREAEGRMGPIRVCRDCLTGIFDAADTLDHWEIEVLR